MSLRRKVKLPLVPPPALLELAAVRRKVVALRTANLQGWDTTRRIPRIPPGSSDDIRGYDESRA